MPELFLELESEMKLRDEDKRWLTEIAKDAAKDGVKAHLNPTGWRKFAAWLRDWSLVALVPTVIIALLAMTLSAAYYAFSRVSKQATFEANTGAFETQANERLTTIETSLRKLSGEVGSARLQQFSMHARDPQNINGARVVLAAAQADKIALSSSVVVDAAKKFLEVSRVNPAAWPTVVAFLNYRAYLNSVTVQLPPQLPPDTNFQTHYQVSKLNVPVEREVRYVGVSKAPDVPQLRSISAPDLNKNLTTGPSLLVLDAPMVVLDNLYVKRVVIRNSHVIYKGGPVVLDEVYFLNCTFDIVQTMSGQELASAILSPKEITYFSKNNPT